MLGDRNWVDISFTPQNGKTVEFRHATITFPILSNGLTEPVYPAENPEDWIGSQLIRIRSSNIADIPSFPVGRIGVFQGVWRKTGARYTTINAIVSQSTAGDLIIECKSLDGVTSPVSYTRPY